MALFSDSVVTLANPPLPLDPAQVRQDVEVLKAISSLIDLYAPPGLGSLKYAEGDSPAVVKLKLAKAQVELTYWFSVGP